MKYSYILLLTVFALNAYAIDKDKDDKQKHLIKNAWKLEQLYYDSISASIDSVMTNFRLVPANDSLCYLNDGTNGNVFYWIYQESNQTLSLYGNKSSMNTMNSALTFNVIYLDCQNLILTVDLSKQNFPVKLIEYRLIPDPDFFNHRK